MRPATTSRAKTLERGLWLRLALSRGQYDRPCKVWLCIVCLCKAICPMYQTATTTASHAGNHGNCGTRSVYLLHPTQAPRRQGKKRNKHIWPLGDDWATKFPLPRADTAHARVYQDVP